MTTTTRRLGTGLVRASFTDLLKAQVGPMTAGMMETLTSEFGSYPRLHSKAAATQRDQVAAGLVEIIDASHAPAEEHRWDAYFGEIAKVEIGRGTSLADALGSQEVYATWFYRSMISIASPHHTGDFHRLASFAASVHAVAIRSIKKAYHATMALDGTADTARSRLAHVLVTDPDKAPALACTAGVPLDSHYTVIAMEDDRLSEAEAKHILSTRMNGYLLLLFGGLPADWDEQPWQWARRMSVRTTAVTGLSTTRPRRELPLAVKEAIVAAHRPAFAATGPMRFTDWLPALAVAEHGADVAEVLAGYPFLLETLLALFDHDLDLRATASALFVHRNTLTRRLRSISDLTGVDPRGVAGARLLAATIDARTLRRAG